MTRSEECKTTYIFFIMSVLVILIHSVNNDTKFQLFFSENGVGQFAVPTFFFVSAFLFFRTVRSTHDIIYKLRKRLRTVLVPYLLWNLIYYGVNLLMKPGSGVIFDRLYDAAFNYTYNPTFWFVCQLMLLNVISPLLHYVLDKNIYIIIFVVVISLFIYYNIDIPYINEDAIIYYFAGAMFAKFYNKNRVKYISKKYAVIYFIVAIFVFVINRIIHSIIGTDMNLFRLFILSIVYTRLSFAIAIFYIFDLIFKYDREYKFMKHTFFIYAMHYMIVKGMIRVMQYITYNYLPADIFLIIETIVFMISPIVCVAICDKLANFLNRKCHKAFIVLTGGRL